MGLVSWIVFGVLIGWIATLVAGLDEEYGCFFNIGLGIIGGILGGIVSTVIIKSRSEEGLGGFLGLIEWSPQRVLWSMVGALIVVVIVTIFRRAYLARQR
ncbi:MAG: hypothetical protein GXY52_05775 [Chloroflexi bacterium]|nr:hypothetical protein [Chloroflexota bacterium]